MSATPSWRWMVLGGLALAAAFAHGTASASPTACPEHFVARRAPDLINPKLADRAEPLCYEDFAVLHSGLTRTPLWSAEHLTQARVLAAHQLVREGEFHAETALPTGEAADLADYHGSGYDRGHMSPNGDMSTPEAQQQSFTLANMVPQAPRLNRGLWEGIESTVRQWAVRTGDLYVVTGPVFQGTSLQMIGGRVLVPTSMFKAVYEPSRGRAGVYLCRNTNDSSYQTISVSQLTALTGIDVFPAVSPAIKARAITLPAPRSHYGGRGRQAASPSYASPSLGGMMRSLLGGTRR